MTDTTTDLVVQDVVWLDPDEPVVAPSGMDLIANNDLNVGDVYVAPPVPVITNVASDGTQAI